MMDPFHEYESYTDRFWRAVEQGRTVIAPGLNLAVCYLPPGDFRDIAGRSMSHQAQAGCVKDAFQPIPNAPCIPLVIISERESAGRKERLRHGQCLVHEIAHARGASELEARRSDREYLRRNGLRGPSDRQIFLQILLSCPQAIGLPWEKYGGLYPLAEVRSVEEKVYGSVGSRLGTLVRATWVLATEGRYHFQRDYHTSKT